jgi:hypothetical protein
MGHEPVAVINLVLSVIRSGLAFAVGMGWIFLTPEQTEQALVFASAVFLLVDVAATWWIRQKVAPVEKFPISVQLALDEGRHKDVRVGTPTVTQP